MNKDEEIRRLDIKAVEHCVKMAYISFKAFKHNQPSKLEYIAFMKGVLAEMKTSMLWKHCTILENFLSRFIEENGGELTEQERLCEEIAHYIAIENTTNKNQEYFENHRIETTLDFPNAGVTYEIKIEIIACEKK